jgi:SOS-response transcriptional repressor LexA
MENSSESANRLRKLRKDCGYQFAVDAARAYGWNRHTYISHENGSRDISKKAAQRYGDAFGQSIDYILTGKSYAPRKIDKLDPPYLALQLVALLSWPQINAGTTKTMLEQVSQDFVYVSRRAKIGPRCRAFIVEDESMINPQHKHAIYPGDEVIFDPDAAISPGDLLVCAHPQLLRAAPRVCAQRLNRETGKLEIELQPLNSAYPTLPLTADNSGVRGKVVWYSRSL